MQMNQTSIQLLPEHIVDQIKAGEVIERPSTLIKEILENAIDAGATKLDLHLIENGLELISLIDNGKGISAEELPLAFCRHATSKIDKFEDIYHLNSYGFRGEALASIASVSKVSCESTTVTSYGQINIDGGLTSNHYVEERKSNTTGTKLFIKDLFYNTPVRMKFIQSKTSEKNHIKKIIHSFLLDHFDKEFSLKWDNKEKEIYPKKENQADRIKDVLFKGQSIELEEISASYDGVSVKLFLSHESSRGNAHKSHFLFVNQRYVKEMAIHKVILNSAAALWPEGETGHYICFVEMPADEIDVNVHPNKTVIKFFRLNKVLSILSGAIKAKLAPKKHTPNVSVEQQNSFLSHESKEVQYRQVDFTSQSETQQYLEHIHTQPAMDITDATHGRVLTQTDDYFIYQREDKLYVGSIKSLVNGHIIKELSHINSEATSPLLVSKPLDFQKKLTEEELEMAFKFGFELDRLDGTTYVARTFYLPLQSYPYLSILKLLVQNNFKFEQVDFAKTLENFKLGHLALADLLEELGLSYLMQNRVLKELTAKKLGSLYES